MNAEQQAEVLDELRVSVPFMVESLKRIEKILEGNGKPGLIADFQDLKREFDVHKTNEVNCPLVTDVKFDLEQMKSDIKDLQNDAKGRKEQDEKKNDRSFTINLEKKKFWNGTTLTLLISILGWSITIGLFVLNYIKP